MRIKRQSQYSDPLVDFQKNLLYSIPKSNEGKATMTQSFNPTPPTIEATVLQSNQPMNVQLSRRMKIGANTFYYIAIVNVVSSFVMVGFYGINDRVTGAAAAASYIFGLAVNSLISLLAIAAGTTSSDLVLPGKLMGITLSIIISCVIALFGFFANKGHKWAFIIGIILYILDIPALIIFSLVFFPVDWVLVVLFRFFILRRFYLGLQALNQLPKNMPKPISDFPQNIGVS